jgi:hypothetical protein
MRCTWIYILFPLIWSSVSYEANKQVLHIFPKAADTTTLDMLQGEWKGRATGELWSENTKTVDPGTKMLIEHEYVRFYRNGELVRATPFRLQISKSISNQVESYVMVLKDTGEEWSIRYASPGDRVSWYGKVPFPFLEINRNPDCVFDCPLEIYSKRNY